MAVYIASAVPSIILSQRNKLLICATAVRRNIVRLTADSRVSTATIVRNKATSLMSADLGCAPNPRKQHPTARHRTYQISLEGAPTFLPDKYPLFQVSDLDKDKHTPQLITIVSVHGKYLPMEVNTGAALCHKETYLSTWSANTRPPLRPSHVKLRT